MESGRASRTAVFVCQGRAVSDGRIAVGRFADPIAVQLLTTQERETVLVARAEGLPGDGRERFAVESLRACAEVVVPRTVLLDELLAERLSETSDAQVVLLGAGLDSRPWRLAALAATPTFSVDHPATQADLHRRATGLGEPPIDLRYVPVDLTVDALAPALAAAGHHPKRPTVWLWEGVVPYLTAPQVTTTVAAAAATSAPGSALLVNFQSRSLVAALGRRVNHLLARLARVENPLADEPWKSSWSPDAFAAVLGAHGFAAVRHEGLLDVAHRLGSPTEHSRSLANGHVTMAIRTSP